MLGECGGGGGGDEGTVKLTSRIFTLEEATSSYMKRRSFANGVKAWFKLLETLLSYHNDDNFFILKICPHRK